MGLTACKQNVTTRAKLLRGLFIFGERKDLTQRTQRRTDGESAGKREDEEAAFAGNDHGEGVAVGRDGEIAKANAVKKRDGLRLRDGNVMSR